METASLLSGAFYILFLVLRALGFCHVKKKNGLPQLTWHRIQSSVQQSSAPSLRAHGNSGGGFVEGPAGFGLDAF